MREVGIASCDVSDLHLALDFCSYSSPIALPTLLILPRDGQMVAIKSLSWGHTDLSLLPVGLHVFRVIKSSRLLGEKFCAYSRAKQVATGVATGWHICWFSASKLSVKLNDRFF